eukprot:SAG31_NODE_1055_length_10134_cov_14.461837_7_plen_67_part_00
MDSIFAAQMTEDSCAENNTIDARNQKQPKERTLSHNQPMLRSQRCNCSKWRTCQTHRHLGETFFSH